MTNWSIVRCQDEMETEILVQLCVFVFDIFLHIFPHNKMTAEKCTIFNEKTAKYPMLITNSIPIHIRTSVKNMSIKNSNILIYHLAHELMHYVIRQYKSDKEVYVRWFEETVCEAMSLYILELASKRWSECVLSLNDPKYGQAIQQYKMNAIDETPTEGLKKCSTLADLTQIESTCENKREDRVCERNYLYSVFLKHPHHISEIANYTKYIMSNRLLIDFDMWENEYAEAKVFISSIKVIQPNIKTVASML